MRTRQRLCFFAGLALLVFLSAAGKKWFKQHPALTLYKQLQLGMTENQIKALLSIPQRHLDEGEPLFFAGIASKEGASPIGDEKGLLMLGPDRIKEMENGEDFWDEIYLNTKTQQKVCKVKTFNMAPFSFLLAVDGEGKLAYRELREFSNGKFRLSDLRKKLFPSP